MNYSTNSSNIQVNVKGFKKVYESNGMIVHTNGQYCNVFISGTFTANAWATFSGTVPSGYRPVHSIRGYTTAQSSSTNTVYLHENGTVVTINALSGTQVYTTFSYPLI